MQNKRINIVLLLLPLLLVSCHPVLDRKFSELDRELKKSGSYMSDFRHRADSLESILSSGSLGDSSKWELCYLLYSSFTHINLDSTARYCSELERYACDDDLRMRTEACRLNCLRLSGDIEEMGKVQGLDAMKVAPEFLSDWYFLLQRSYDKVYDSLAVHYMNEAISSDAVSFAMKARMRGLICVRTRDNEGTVKQFQKVYELSETYHMKAMAAFNLARAYSRMGDDDSAAFWMAEAAINDIKVPCKEYASLSELSLMLIRSGHYRRASSYLNTSMRDAIGGQWNSNVFNYAEGQIAVANALKHSTDVMSVFIALLVLLVLGMLFMYMRVLRQKQELHRVNGLIREMNVRLADEGKIKEAYLFKYMGLAVEYLGKEEAYRHDLRTALKEEGVDGVKAMLRAPEKRNVYRDFYEKFDITFRKLYPDFVSKVNLLLKEDARFSEELPFCTDLRILATLRLGFRESKQIAAFLNVPVTSVYSRRSAMRRSAACDRDEFEEKVREII